MPITMPSIASPVIEISYIERYVFRESILDLFKLL